MKNYYRFILITICCLISIIARCQEVKEKDVPATVKKSFQSIYSNSYVYEWEWKKKEKLYEAEFMDNGNKCEAYFNQAGEWIETTIGIKRDQLPQAIVDNISKSEYKDFKIDDVEEINTSQYKVLYKVEVEKGKRELYLYFLPDGKLIETSTKK